MKFQNKGAVPVQIAPLFIQVAPLFISQPHSQNHSIEAYFSPHTLFFTTHAGFVQSLS